MAVELPYKGGPKGEVRPGLEGELWSSAGRLVDGGQQVAGCLVEGGGHKLAGHCCAGGAVTDAAVVAP